MLVRSLGRAALLGSVLFVLAAGCAPSRSARVFGAVRVDGQLVEKGSIAFIPADGQGPTAGSDIKEGKYDAPKVAIGLMKVEIRVPKVTGEKKLYEGPNSPTRKTFTEALPDKFHNNTVLRFEVQPGKNEKDWDLSTK
jgi:hypothetical protein